MSAEAAEQVAAEDADIRLDRWFARHYPALAHGRLQRLLRSGQIRVDGKRARAGLRLAAGQRVRVPPQVRAAEACPAPPRPRGRGPSRADFAALRARVLYRDDDILALDKPAGLAVQGGSGLSTHLDALAEALRFEAEAPPRLVHRRDKDTSGVLVLARNAAAAARLTRLFREGRVHKTYWAIVVGVPPVPGGVIDRPLAKRGGPGRERVAADAGGRAAVTRWRRIAAVGKRVAWLALEPVTGRTHQLRAHCAALGTPILGDGKYGGAAAHPADLPPGVGKRLHLHAREIVLPHADGGNLRFVAPLPDAMRAAFEAFGFDADAETGGGGRRGGRR